MLRSKAFFFCMWYTIHNYDQNVPENDKHYYLIKLFKEMEDKKAFEKINILYTFFEENKYNLYQTLDLITERKNHRMIKENDKFREAVRKRINERRMTKLTFGDAVKKYLNRI